MSGDPEVHVDEEVEVARWMALDVAARELTYKGDRKMVTMALARLNGGDG